MTVSWKELSDRLSAVLDLDAPPISITFRDEAPAGVALILPGVPQVQDPLVAARRARTASTGLFASTGLEVA